jgi:integrase
MERRKTTIRKLNEYLYGNKCWQRTPRSLRTHRSSHEPLKCPEQFREVFEEFLESLKREGLKDVTLEMYRSFCIRHLLSNFAEQGIADWCDIDVKALTSAFSDTTSKVTFATYARRLFGYLLKNGIVSADYSSILPMVTKRKVLPSVYSEEEIQRLLDTIETITPQGKRDYTMVLIAARLGLRVSDIARLCFENVDFDRAIVKFVQYKTSVPHQLPLPVEVENALLDYIGNGREESDEPYIFLDGHGRPMANHTIGHIGARHLKNSGVEIGERKGGMHALRSSFASQLVADKVPYDVVRYALGHVHPNSTRHYVQFAVESLRACALEVPLPSGLFKKYLEGGM